jgi:CheY-like chemotaxis protein
MVLLVEEDAEQRRLLAHLLSGQGYSVLQAGKAQDAPGIAAEHELDVIVLGAPLPSPQGLSMLDALKQGERTGRIPVVVVGTAGHGAADREACRAAALAREPFWLATVLSHVERAATK